MDEQIAELLAAQNAKLERIAVALEAMVEQSCRTACALEIPPPLIATLSGPLQPPFRPAKK